jgi:hypothetical protein
MPTREQKTLPEWVTQQILLAMSRKVFVVTYSISRRNILEIGAGAAVLSTPFSAAKA